MNVDTDLKIEKTEYPLTGEVEYRIKMRVPTTTFDWRIFTPKVTGEKWTEHPNIYDAFDWPIWSDSITVFTSLEKAEASLTNLKNYYLRKTFKTEIL